MVYKNKKSTRMYKSGDACEHVMLCITGLTNHEAQNFLSEAVNLETKISCHFQKFVGGGLKKEFTFQDSQIRHANRTNN